MPSSSNIYNQSFGIWLSYVYMKIMSVQGIEENGCLPKFHQSNIGQFIAPKGPWAQVSQDSTLSFIC